MRKGMNTKASNKDKNHLRRNYLIILAFINSIFIGIIFLITLKVEVNVIKLIIFVCLMFLYVNVRFIFSYFKVARSLASVKTYYDLDKSDRKKLICAILLLLSSTVLGVFLLFAKEMVWCGIGILIVSSYTYLFFHNKLFRTS